MALRERTERILRVYHQQMNRQVTNRKVVALFAHVFKQPNSFGAVPRPKVGV